MGAYAITPTGLALKYARGEQPGFGWLELAGFLDAILVTNCPPLSLRWRLGAGFDGRRPTRQT